MALVTSTDLPGRRGCAGAADCSTAIRTGTRWTTLVKLPVALSGGRSAKRAPVAGLRLSTLPWKVMSSYASTVNSTGSPTLTLSSCVSLRLAVTQMFFSGTTDIRFCPTCTWAPGSAVRLASIPSIGASSAV